MKILQGYWGDEPIWRGGTLIKRLAKEDRLEAEKAQVCPYGLCDGTGEYDEGEFDDIETKKCLCTVDEDREYEQYKESLT